MTLEMAVAPIALAMANHPDLERFDLSSLRYIMWGATPVSEHVARTVTERSGVRWLPAYGASEVPVIAVNPVGDPGSWRLDSAGLPPEGVELRVADLDTGAVLAPGETGEIQVRSPSVMAGYLPEEETAGAFADGWYRTGDVGWLEPEGWVHLTDRSKEMIKVNGFQVAPAEIEGVLRGHPAVLDCAVFGLVDERAGEVPVAAVQLDPSRPPPPTSSRRWWPVRWPPTSRCATSSSSTPFPGSPRGRSLRRTLRDEWTPVLLASARERLMDVRLSPEQQALRDSAAQVVDRLGPGTVRQPRRRRAGRPGSTPPWPPRAGASSGCRWTDGSPLASGVEVAVVAEELGRGLADTPFLGPTLAAELRRLAGAPPAATAETVAFTASLSGPAVAADGRRARRHRGRRRPGRARRPWCWCPTAGATRWPRSPCGPVGVGTDLTRPGAAVDPGVRGHPGGGTGHPAAHRRRPVDVDRARAGPRLCRPGRDDARCRRPRRRLRLGPAPVRPAHRLVPGRPAPVGRRLRR